jgi:hypothetical protein
MGIDLPNLVFDKGGEHRGNYDNMHTYENINM